MSFKVLRTKPPHTWIIDMEQIKVSHPPSSSLSCSLQPGIILENLISSLHFDISTESFQNGSTGNPSMQWQINLCSHTATVYSLTRWHKEVDVNRCSVLLLCSFTSRSCYQMLTHTLWMLHIIKEQMQSAVCTETTLWNCFWYCAKKIVLKYFEVQYMLYIMSLCVWNRLQNVHIFMYVLSLFARMI